MELKFKHFISLNVADILLTWYALTYLGLHEGNPILEPIFNEIGLLLGLVLIKVIGVGLLYGTIFIWRSIFKIIHLNISKKIVSTTIITTGCFVFMLVVANNIYQIIQTTFML